ncbi:MAG: bifunctional DNA-formamidopyrimidine glycosylase/DNA-(apurinic or apyrimidinic site) lyase [bacterium]|nr:bifunctional DNA-formamidopyrimidine glycosylase/DNA-(apurinic or apyrimidinic site) lyase [Acidimicrobiia bacterium]MCY4649655.1 bifunctional DNA-formamidopyrimidine glycosylase/DNA-(apurinic or apyrimidinic site) lyase [bacterium]
MPELPEVETVRRAIHPELVGRRVERARICHARTARRHARSTDVEDRLVGRRVTGTDRIGKFLILQLDSDLAWVIHLGMSGRIRLVPPEDPQEVHTRFWAETDSGPSLRFIDARTFGFVAVFTSEEMSSSSLAKLGPDAWNELPSAHDLGMRMEGRSIAVKSLLLDQRFLAGLGNIYADEVLHRAGIHPARPAGSLSGSEVGMLHSRVRPVLRDGIRRGGTSLDDLAYLLPDGRAGGFLEYLQAYGREGRPCRTCHTAIRRIVIRARSCFFCPRCQRPPFT